MNIKKRVLGIKTGIKSIGVLLIIIGIFIIIIQPFSTTGAAIDLSTAVSRIWFFIGLGLVVVGIAMQFAEEKEEKLGGLEKLTSSQRKLVRRLGENLRSGKVGTSKELIEYAEKLGYVLMQGKGSGYKVIYSNGEPLIGASNRQVEIHNHPGDMDKGIYRAITKDLVNGIKE